jgi:hypothetical protein
VADSEDAHSASSGHTVHQWKSATGELLAIYAKHTTSVLGFAVPSEWSNRLVRIRRRLCLRVGCSAPGRATSEHGQSRTHILRWSLDSTACAECATSGDIKVLDVSTGGHIISFSAFASPAGLSFWPLPLHSSPWSLIEHLEQATNGFRKEHMWPLVTVFGYSA